MNSQQRTNSGSLITAASRDISLPASWGELEFFYQQKDGNNAMVLPVSFMLEGLLDIEALEISLKIIVGRHEILRTTYFQNGPNVLRKINGIDTFSFRVVDMLGIGPEEQPTAIKDHIDAESDIIDLSVPPLFKVTLVKLAKERHFLLLTFHHILIDGFSINLFSDELSEIYNGLVTGKAPNLSQLPFQYADFAYWQQNSSYQDDVERDQRYWEDKLKNLKTLNLPTLQRTGYSPLFGLIPLRFEGDLIRRIEEICKVENSILYGGLSAALCIVLAHYALENEVSTNCPIAMNKYWQTDKVIGFFLNIVVVTHTIDINQSFSELLRTVKKNCVEAFKHKHAPSMKLYETIENLQRWKPIAINLLPFRELRLAGLKPAECALEMPLPYGTHTPGIYQIWNLHIRSWGISGSLYYNAKLLEESMMHRMIADFHAVLEWVAEHPTTALKNLPMFK